MKKTFITLAVIAILIPTLCAAQETATQTTDNSAQTNAEITTPEKTTTDTEKFTNSESTEAPIIPKHNPRIVPKEEPTQETTLTSTQQKTTKTATTKKSTQESQKDEETSIEKTNNEKPANLEPVELPSFDLNLNTQDKEPLKIHTAEENYTQQEIPEGPVQEKIINNQIKIAIITIGSALGLFLIWATITLLINLIKKR